MRDYLQEKAHSWNTRDIVSTDKNSEYTNSTYDRYLTLAQTFIILSEFSLKVNY